MKNNLTQLSDCLAVTGQISSADLPHIKSLGFRSLICNRPDGEGGQEQPTHTEIQIAAQALGLTLGYLPVTAETVDANTAAFAALLEGLEPPILAYCRTGNRSTKLYEGTLAIG
ncbi:beta-lactamase hydrolase domain-containing protein [Pseudomonas putida]|uniref:beta-lactamase hydrolase domain-containing protein n=1 Tax=Pseudomonas putida TaxID=303 RepID=UPI00036A790A|nr:sulfur transferase domain-containing protein [Pseudomonas putida]